MEVATKLAPANDLATPRETAKRNCRSDAEGDKIAELELANSQLRQLVIELLGWHEPEIRRRRAKPAKRTSKQAARRRAP
jgi:hypothetical protein